MESADDDDEFPIIVSVCSLSDKSDSIALTTDDSVSSDSTAKTPINPQYKPIIKDEKGKAISPSEYLRTFQPFQEQNVQIPPTNSASGQYNTIHQARLPNENIATDSLQMPYLPRVTHTTYTRPTLPAPADFTPAVRHTFPGVSTGRTRPLAPHMILQSQEQVSKYNFQKIHQMQSPVPSYTSHRMMHHSQRPVNRYPIIRQDLTVNQIPPPAKFKPMSPHESSSSFRQTLKYSDNQFNLLNMVPSPFIPLPNSEHIRSRSQPISTPIKGHIIPSPHPQRTHSKTSDTAKPLAPHELVNPSRIDSAISQQDKPIDRMRQFAAPSTSYQGNAFSSSAAIEQQIIDFLHTCEFESALKISKAINQPRKVTLDVLSELSEQSIVITKQDMTPHLYILYDKYQNNYATETPVHSQQHMKRPLSRESNSVCNNSKRIDTSSKEFNMDPVSLLAHLCNKKQILLDYRVVNSFQRGSKVQFEMEVSVGNKVYTAIGPNKKEAKKDVSDLALKDMLVEGRTNSDLRCISFMGTLNPHNLHSEIAIRAQQFFLHVIFNVPEAQTGRKVFACIFLETPENQFQIVSVGSGTRCCAGSVMSCSGDVIHDTHAEIIARRALIRFLILKLQSFYNCEEEEMFVMGEDGMLELQKGYKFHLYISHAPCGDSAIFVRSDTEHKECLPDGSHNPTFSNKNQGLLRTKIEEGEGTLPCDNIPLTMDGILGGSRLRVMSCSDKVGRWNVIGLQGALLTHFIRPIYLSSITLGALFHHGHLSRAVCCRFDHPELVSILPHPYRVVHPVLGSVSGKEEIKRHVGKTSSGSLNWTPFDSSPEFLDGGTGRPTSKFLQKLEQLNSKSRLSKLSLLQEFRDLCRISGMDYLTGLNYRECKDEASEYQQAKANLSFYCKKVGLGVWAKLPREVDEFN